MEHVGEVVCVIEKWGCSWIWSTDLCRVRNKSLIDVHVLGV
ncbi:hypothetical protein CASFOL_020843 [Castilleja foliolosa]|uniref:Uncharacterized protein n=1 Tax=Castilleja foliolosa TaxID=1961234 RepID=A0ABD3D5M9_9LAMI